MQLTRYYQLINSIVDNLWQVVFGMHVCNYEHDLKNKESLMNEK